jgi:DNA-binding NarL/FixJ family response regulator
MASRKPRIFLVAGNRLLREALARLFKSRGDFNVSAVSSGVSDGLRSSMGVSGSYVLILDSVSAQLPDCRFISRMIGQAPGIKVVLIDMDEDSEMFLKCVRAGAMGYLLKEASAEEVLSGVRAVTLGQAVCPPRLLVHLYRAFSRKWTEIPSSQIKLELGLTRRQQQLVPLIAQGLTNKEIAIRLNLSEQTIKNHIHGIMRRVGAGDRMQVVDLTRYSATLQ